MKKKKNLKGNYGFTFPPIGAPMKSKMISIYLPNLELLSFLTLIGKKKPLKNFEFEFVVFFLLFLHFQKPPKWDYSPTTCF